MKFEAMPMPPSPEEREEIPRIPDNEFTYTVAKSSGPGGQNVNKKNTKAHVRWHVLGSKAGFTDEQKAKIETTYPKRMDPEGCLFADSGATRSQPQNIALAKERIQELVDEALTPVAERKATKPTRAAKERRLEEKRQQAQKKEGRRGGWDE